MLSHITKLFISNISCNLKEKVKRQKRTYYFSFNYHNKNYAYNLSIIIQNLQLCHVTNKYHFHWHRAWIHWLTSADTLLIKYFWLWNYYLTAISTSSFILNRRSVHGSFNGPKHLEIMNSIGYMRSSIIIGKNDTTWEISRTFILDADT